MRIRELVKASTGLVPWRCVRIHNPNELLYQLQLHPVDLWVRSSFTHRRHLLNMHWFVIISHVPGFHVKPSRIVADYGWNFRICRLLPLHRFMMNAPLTGRIRASEDFSSESHPKQNSQFVLFFSWEASGTFRKLSFCCRDPRPRQTSKEQGNYSWRSFVRSFPTI